MTEYRAVTVYNESMPRDKFDQLCNVLKSLRPLSHDYRMINGFDTKPFWQSQSYDRREFYFAKSAIETTLESVLFDIERFCKLNQLSVDLVTVEITSLKT